MNKKITILITLLGSFFSFGQYSNEVVGLWEVTYVSVGKEEMTPNGKWTRFNEDGTQQSGNGWRQHTFGTWRYDEQNKSLSIVNTNFIEDPYGHFSVSFDGEEMIWKRMEDGAKIEVFLKRITDLPTTLKDNLLGLWELTDVTGDDSFFKEAGDIERSYLFLRWDGKFVIGLKERKIYGVYNVHGHKPEIELIPYPNGLARSFWNVKLVDNALKIRLLDGEEEVRRAFKRINRFPN